jgi:uncharacterized DUF497 family protein
MNDIRFLRDPAKNKVNAKKHGVDFEEARTVFYDPNAIQYLDPDHSEEEERFILLGLSARRNVLIVCHCYREKDSLIRIISARKADKTEKENYRRKDQS